MIFFLISTHVHTHTKKNQTLLKNHSEKLSMFLKCACNLVVGIESLEKS